MMFGGLIIVGLIIYYFYKNNGGSMTLNNEAEEKLKHRFINGEIDEETYLRMKNILKK